MPYVVHGAGAEGAAHILREGMVAGCVGAVLGGIPSTVHALATGRDPLEATLAAGTIVLRHEQRPSRLMPAALLAHGSISVLWGVVLAGTMPRRRPILSGALAGLAIAAVDLGLVGRRIPRLRALPLGPQVADHVLFGAAVGTVLARPPHAAVAPPSERRRRRPATRTG